MPINRRCGCLFENERPNSGLIREKGRFWRFKDQVFLQIQPVHFRLLKECDDDIVHEHVLTIDANPEMPLGRSMRSYSPINTTISES